MSFSFKSTGGLRPHYLYQFGTITYYCQYYSGECEDKHILKYIQNDDKILSLESNCEPFTEWIQGRVFTECDSKEDKKEALRCIVNEMRQASRKIACYTLLKSEHLDILLDFRPNNNNPPKDQDLLDVITESWSFAKEIKDILEEMK